MKNYDLSKIGIFILSLFSSLGVYILFITLVLLNYRPNVDSSVFIPLYRPEIHPKPDIYLYLFGIMFIPLASIIFYALFYFLIGGLHDRVKMFLGKLAMGGKLILILGLFILTLFLAYKLFVDYQFYNFSLVSFLQKEDYVFLNGFSRVSLLFSFYVLSILFLVYIRGREKMNIFIDIIVLVLIMAAVSIVATNGWGRAESIVPNYNPVMGPVNDVLGGKTLLVNTNSQYGLLFIYSLAGLFKFINLSYNNFFWLNFAVIIVGYYLLYLIMRRWLGWIALLGIFLILENHYFGGGVNLILQSQQTFLRWGWWIVILAILVFSDRLKVSKNARERFELILIGIAFFWAFDTGIYTLMAYLGYRVVRIFLLNPKLEDKIRGLMFIFLRILAILLAFWLLIFLYTYLRSGSWPDFSRFISTASQFAGGFGLRPMPLVGFYWVVLAMYLGILGYILFIFFIGRKNLAGVKIQELGILAFVNILGIFQFIYYTGRTTAGNLHVVIIPFILLLCWAVAKFKNYYRLNGLSELNPSRKILLAEIGILFIFSLSIMITIGTVNMFNAYKERDNLLLLSFDEIEKRPAYKQSIESINSYLAGKKGKMRSVAIVSTWDGFFLIKTKSVNVIDSNNLDYFVRISQFRELGQQILDRKPGVVFADHVNNFEMVPLILSSIKDKYHYYRNVGYLDEWVLN